MHIQNPDGSDYINIEAIGALGENKWSEFAAMYDEWRAENPCEGGEGSSTAPPTSESGAVMWRLLAANWLWGTMLATWVCFARALWIRLVMMSASAPDKTYQMLTEVSGVLSVFPIFCSSDTCPSAGALIEHLISPAILLGVYTHT